MAQQEDVSSPGILLVDALRSKYCPAEEEDAVHKETTVRDCGEVREFAIASRPGRVPVGQLSTVVLERSGITHSGPGEELAELCPVVQQLCLGGNSISDWESVWTILSSLPQLRTLDLARNSTLFRFSPSLFSCPSLYPNLQALILNQTCTSLADVVSILHLFPNLSELHLVQNGYSDADIEQVVNSFSSRSPSHTLSPSHSGLTHTPSSSIAGSVSLTRLHIACNNITRWGSIQQLGHLFPNLETLVAISNPLTSVCANTHHFKKLQSLNLNETDLSDWTSVECLSDLPSLTDLSLLKTPLGADLAEKYRRFATIARVPLLTRLNKSAIGVDEREDAERWLIRQYDSLPDHSQPRVYRHLVTKHGIVDQLADVDLSPKKKATLEFHFEDPERPVETHTVSLKQTTKQFKSWICKNLLGVPPSCNLLLMYGDQEGLEMYGTERMMYDRKMLFSYRMKDGDQIHVVIR